MLRTGYLLLFMLAFAGTAFAQRGQVTPSDELKGTIHGSVVDSSNGEPLQLATISIRNAVDSSLVTGALTRKDGSFSITGLQPGRYRARISYIGLRPKIIEDIRIQPANLTVSLGRIALLSDTTLKQEVTVSAKRDFMTVGIDRTTYKTSDMLVSTGGTGIDLLRNIPAIEVDIDDNISLRGNQNVVVQIDGRPTLMSGAALASFLRSLPANSIERIEVMPNPSAKFDPDGMSGIINIVMKHNEDRGLSGGINAGVGTSNAYTIGGNINYGTGPWNIFANYGFNMGDREYHGSTFQENLLVTPITSLRSEDARTSQRYGQTFNGAIDYAFDARNSLSLTTLLNPRYASSNSLTNYFSLDSVRTLTSRYDRGNVGTNPENAMDYRLRYKWVEQTAHHELNVEARLSTSNEADHIDYRQQNLDLQGIPENQSPQLQHNDLNERHSEYALQIDYTRPLWAPAQLETGYKGSFRRIDNDFFSATFNNDSNAFTPDIDLNNTFIYDEQVHALYATYSQEFGAFGVQAGLRAEQANTTFNLTTTAQTFDNSYFSLFPSAFLTYKPAEGSQFKLSYSKRINRPRTGALNPFTTNNNPSSRRVGNPFLQPEYIHSFELNYTQYLNWGTLTLSPYFRRRINGIERFERFDSSGVVTQTFVNFGKNDAYGGEVITTARLGDRVTAFANVEAFRSVTDATNVEAGLTDAAFGWSVRFNGSVDLGWGLDLQASMFYEAPFNISGGGRIASHSFSDIALQKKLFDDRARLGIRVSDPFNTMGFSMYRSTSAYYEEATRKWTSRTAMLTFSYVFGSPDKRQQRSNQGAQQDGGGDSGW